MEIGKTMAQTAVRNMEELLVNAGFAEEYGLGAGDTFQLYDSGMNAHTVTIAGIFANYTAVTAAISWTVHFLAFRKIRGLKLSDLQK